jgi:hypothetical protein
MLGADRGMMLVTPLRANRPWGRVLGDMLVYSQGFRSIKRVFPQCGRCVNIHRLHYAQKCV